MLFAGAQPLCIGLPPTFCGLLITDDTTHTGRS